VFEYSDLPTFVPLLTLSSLSQPDLTASVSKKNIPLVRADRSLFLERSFPKLKNFHALKRTPSSFVFSFRFSRRQDGSHIQRRVCLNFRSYVVLLLILVETSEASISTY